MWAAKYVTSAVVGETIPEAVKGKTFYDLQAPLPGSKGTFDFGKPVLIVNTASKCGFTPQLTGLEELNQKFGSKGLQVLGFPSNEFGSQDPGTDEDIGSFCQLNHGVTFPLMKKSEVNGGGMNEVFAWLKSNNTESGSIKWNFTKFLVDKEGKVVGRYGPQKTPEQLVPEIEKLL